MRDLDLLSHYLVRVRQEKLQLAHALALVTAESHGMLAAIRIHAHEAELCDRIGRAVKVLTDDPGKFIKEFLGESE
jgi:hypothetical protein